MDLEFISTEGSTKEHSFRNLKECRNQIVATAIVTLGSFGTGTVFGWSAVASSSIKTSNFGAVSDEMISWVTSLAIVGAFLGGPLAGVTMDYLGRKAAITIFAFPFVVGWIIMFSARFFAPDGFFLLYIGRLVTGICAGSYLVIIPTYIKEISSDVMSGVLGSAMPLMLVSGMLYTFVIGTLCDWDLLTAFCGISPICLLVGTLIIPETPKFLILKNKMDKAAPVYKWLSGAKSVEVAQEKLLRLYPANTSVKELNYTEKRGLLTRPVALPVIIMVFVMLFQQFGGINAVTMYTVQIFELTGNFLLPHTATIILGVVQVVFVLLSMFLVDILGRKTLLISCNLIMATSLLGFGAYFYMKENGDNRSEKIAWLPVVAVFTYVAAYSCGVGSIPWVLANEIYNPDYRAESATVMTTMYWIFGFIVTKTYDDLKSALNASGTFWFYGAFCFGGAIFAALFVPETKGKSMEKILLHFGASSKLPANNNYDDLSIKQHEMIPIANARDSYTTTTRMNDSVDNDCDGNV